MTVVSEIHPEERVSIDPERFEALCARLGRAAAEAAIAMAMEDIAQAMQITELARRSGDLATLAAEARKVERAAGVMGLVPLARVASDVERLCAQQDGVSLNATAARMRRMGEAALFAMWELQDMRL